MIALHCLPHMLLPTNASTTRVLRHLVDGRSFQISAPPANITGKNRPLRRENPDKRDPRSKRVEALMNDCRVKRAVKVMQVTPTDSASGETGDVGVIRGRAGPYIAIITFTTWAAIAADAADGAAANGAEARPSSQPEQAQDDTSTEQDEPVRSDIVARSTTSGNAMLKSCVKVPTERARQQLRR